MIDHPALLEIAFGADPAGDPEDWTWTEVPWWGDQTVQIRRGRADEASEVAPSQVSFVVDNRSGDYTPDDPRSPYWPDVRRGTPVRFTAALDGVDHVRFVGQVSEWAPEWPYGDLSDHDNPEDRPGEAEVTLVCNGVLRRLGQGAKPLESPLFRHISTWPTTVAYWPMEDGTLTDRGRSVVGGKPLGFASMEWTAETTLPGSRPLPVVKRKATWTGRVKPISRPGWRVSQMVFLPSTDDPVEVLRVVVTDRIFRVAMSDDTVSFEELTRPDGGVNWTPNDYFTTVRLTDQWVRVSLFEDGVDEFDRTLYGTTVHEAGGGLLFEAFGPEGISSPDNPSNVIISVGGRVTAPPEGMAVGHLAITTTEHQHEPEIGWTGETAANRVYRLCGEEGVDLDITTALDDSTPMGVQGTVTFLELLTECAQAELGILGEQTTRPGLTFRTRADRYNQTPVLALDAGQNEIIEPFAPTLDDQRLRNDITVTRQDGATATAVDETSGEETYDDQVTLSLAEDRQAQDHAWWRLHLGTWPGMRYPAISSNLTPAPDGRGAAPQWLDMALGDRVTVENLPPQHPDRDVDVIVEGTTETITPVSWTIEASCSPAGPWDVAVLEEFRLDTDEATLAEPLAAHGGVTTVEIDGPAWSPDYPYDIVIDGEVITIARVTPAITVFGDDLDDLLDDVAVSTGHTAAYIPVEMAYEPGQVAFAAGVLDGRVVVGSLTASGNSFQGSYRHAAFYVFEPATLTWTKVTVLTPRGESPLGSDGFTRGDICSFSVTGDTMWATMAVDYSDWVIGTHGRNPPLIEVDLDGAVGPGSMTVEELKDAAVADAAASFPDAVNAHAETYAQNQGMFSSDTLPNGWIVVADYVTGDTSRHSGGVKLLNEFGIQQAYLAFPDMEMADGTLLSYAPKFVSADPSSVDPTDMRALVSADVFVRGTTTQMPFSVQELTIDASGPTIDYVTAPVLCATHDETVDASDYLGAFSGQYGSDGTAWVSAGQPTVGLGFAQKPMQAFLKTAGERRWTAEAPPSAGWEDRFGEYRLVADFALGVLDRASQLHSGQFEDPDTGGQVVVGFGGGVYPFTPDSPLALRASVLSNSLYAANITGWANFGVSGAVAWDAGDGGRLKATANGTAASLVWQTDSAGVFSTLPAGSVGQSLWLWARVKAAATPRRARVSVNFYTSGGVQIGSQINGPWSYTDTGYTQVACAVEVPATAAKYKLFVSVNRETGGFIPNGEIHYSDEAYLALAPVTHHTTADLDLSLLPLGTADLRWPAGAGVNQAVDDDRCAWLPIRCLENSGTPQPASMPQYLVRMYLPALLGLADSALDLARGDTPREHADGAAVHVASLPIAL